MKTSQMNKIHAKVLDKNTTNLFSTAINKKTNFLNFQFFLIKTPTLTSKIVPKQLKIHSS